MIWLQQAWVRSGRPKYSKPTNGKRSTVIFGRQTGFCEFRCETTYPYYSFDQELSVFQNLNLDHFPFILEEMNLEILHGFFRCISHPTKPCILVEITISGYRWYCWLLFKQIYFAGFVVDFCFSPRKQMQKNWLWNSTGRAQDIVGQVSAGW